jgi:hypothetical protein
MVAVAIVGLMLYGELMRRYRVACLERLAWLAKHEKILASSDPAEDREMASPRLKHGKQMKAAEALEEIAREKRRIEVLASHPWFLTPIDSSPPLNNPKTPAT